LNRNVDKQVKASKEENYYSVVKERGRVIKALPSLFLRSKWRSQRESLKRVGQEYGLHQAIMDSHNWESKIAN